MASPWAKIQPVEGPVLKELSLEQLVKCLQDEEIQNATDDLGRTVQIEDCEVFDPDETDSDAVIAHTEEKFNRDAKVNITYSNYRASTFDDPEDDPSDTEDTARDFDRFVSAEEEYKKIGEGSLIVTKHDMIMSSTINACTVLYLPRGKRIGDTGRFDVKLNNKVFNSPRAHSYAQCSKEKAKARPHTK